MTCPLSLFFFSPCRWMLSTNLNYALDVNFSLDMDFSCCVLAHSLIFKFLNLFLTSFSCRYGEACRYLHVTQQHPKSNVFGGSNQQQKPNPFGFETQIGSQPQQKPNPFGFGVQNSSAPKQATDFGSKQNQSKVLSFPKSLLICQKKGILYCYMGI